MFCRQASATRNKTCAGSLSGGRSFRPGSDIGVDPRLTNRGSLAQVMAYADQGMSRGRMYALAVAIVIHVFLGYALITGLALKAFKHITEPLKTVNIKETPPPPDEPPPPPPKDVEIPPFVPPPEVTVASDVPPPIAVQSVQAPPPQQYQPPQPKADAGAAAGPDRADHARDRRSATRRRFRKTIIRRRRCAPRSRVARRSASRSMRRAASTPAP